MIDYETYKKVQEQLKLGVKLNHICKNLGISFMQLYRYGMLPEDLYIKARESKIDYKFETYRDFIISILQVTPTMNDTAVLYRVKEQFDDFDMAKNTFFRHLRELREYSGYTKSTRNNRGVKAETLPGYEAQADFGQYKMIDMYGKSLRVYFFVMVLSYSRMKFCYFSREPFTTKKAIAAHECAFRYFGGRTQSILYDQDRLFVVSDNFGDFILVKEFEDFVRATGFSANFCHKHDPDSKGKIENVVNYIKTGFLKGRTYEGIDSLNSACLDWLDRFGNGDYHSFTKKIPSDMFREDEAKTLVKVKPYVKQTTFILTVDPNNAVRYKNNRYELDYNLHLSGCKVRVSVTDDEIFIYKPLSNELITKYNLLKGEGHINTCKKMTDKESIYPKVIQNLYGNNSDVKKFIIRMKDLQPDYFVKQTRRLVRMTNFYNKEELLDGIMYCLSVNKASIYELASYLIYKYGKDRGKVYLKYQELNRYIERARVIKEEQDGRN